MKANRSIACLLLAALPTLASAHAAEKVETLRDQALAEIPGHRGLMLTVSFKPGQVSAPHVHPGSVFVYVLEGTVQTQLEGGPVETYTVGQSWYEPANVPHLLARNPDPMKPAKLLVWGCSRRATRSSSHWSAAPTEVSLVRPEERPS